MQPGNGRSGVASCFTGRAEMSAARITYSLVWLLLGGVLSLFALELDLADQLLGLALDLELVVAGGLAGVLLGLALDLFGLVLGLLAETHNRLLLCCATMPRVRLMRGAQATASCPGRWASNS